MHNSKLKRFFPKILLIVVFLLAAAFAFNTFAQNFLNNQGLEVSPPSQEVNIDPGKTVNIKAKVRNKGTETLPISVRVEDFTASGEEGQIAIVKEDPAYSLTSWAKIDPQSFMLKPNEEQEVTATLTVPATAAGGRYGSFVFAVSGPGPRGGEASVTQEIASLFLVKVAGPVNESLSLLEMKAPSFSESGPIPFSLKFQNTGNIHVKTYGLINVVNMFGRKVADVVVTGTNVFPGATRIIKADLDKRFLIGSYTATAIMYYGTTKNQTLTLATSFFVFPVRIVAVLIIVLFLLYLMRKRLKKALKDLFG